jgi:hypothetical protein
LRFSGISYGEWFIPAQPELKALSRGFNTALLVGKHEDVGKG